MTSHTITNTVTSTVVLLPGDELTVTSSGTIEQAGGTAVYSFGDIGTLSNDGLITGNIGVLANGAIDFLLNNGTINGTASDAVFAEGIGTISNAGLINGQYSGIDDEGGLTSLNNETGGVISAASEALRIGGDIGTLSNAGIISAGSTAVAAYGTISELTNNGTISAYLDVYASTIGSLTNDGHITAQYIAVFAEGIGTISNAGLINGHYSGIDDDGGLTSLNNETGGVISAASEALRIGGDIGTLSNAGIISAGSTAVAAYGTISELTNNGTISAYLDVYASTIGSLANDGHITAQYIAVFADSGGLISLNNETGGVISATSQAVYANGDIGTLTNTGTITSANETAVYSGGAITALTNDGLITGSIGIEADSLGAIINDGDIRGTAEGIYGVTGDLAHLDNQSGAIISASSDMAVHISGSIGTLTNEGSITSAKSSAIYSGGTIAVLTNDGTIQGALGIEANSIGIITNSGDIIGQYEAIYAETGTLNVNNAPGGYIHATYVAVLADDAIGTLTNAGTISGGSTAVYVNGNLGALTNDGLLTGSEIGIEAVSVGTLTNSGEITGNGAEAIYVSDGTLTSLDNQSGGSITGEPFAIEVQGSISSLTNAGTIAAGNTAIYSDGTIGTLSNDGEIKAYIAIKANAVGTLTNSGDISGNGAEAIYVSNGSLTSLDNQSGGSITAEPIAIEVQGSVGTLSNEGSIGAGNTAIYSNGTIGTLSNEGKIQAYIAIKATALGTFTNIGGDISGNSVAIDASGGTLTSLDNQSGGSITGQEFAVEVDGSIGTLSNEGTLGAGNTAIYSNGTIGTLSNDGQITGYIAIDANALGTVTNIGGDISGRDAAINVTNGGLTSLTNEAGAIITATQTAIDVTGTIGLLTNAGTITANDYAILSGSAGGTLILDPTSVISGHVEFHDGTLELAGSTANTVTGIGNQYSGFTSISFDNADATAEGSTGGLAGGEAITGFTYGDEIQLDSFVAVSKDYVTGEGLVLTDANSNTETLNIEGAYTTAEFVITNDGTNTTITELCYLRGTRILTPNGEVPVETLKIGDLVVTRQGGFRAIKWIGRQSYDTRFVATDPARLPVRIRPGALGEGLPARDLYISPGHSMLVDGTLLLASTLVNGITITHECPNDTTQIDYFQPELQSHDCILAEGAWSETFADGPGLRAAYHNAPEFWALYPTYQTPETIHLCAPRPERGNALETALRPLVARAAKGVAPGHLQGSIDRVSGREIDGWAFDAANPHLPVLIEVTLDGAVIHTALACDFRQDLRDAGFGLGRCAFFLSLPEDIPAGVLQIRRAGDGATLPMSETCRILRAA